MVRPPNFGNLGTLIEPQDSWTQEYGSTIWPLVEDTKDTRYIRYENLDFVNYDKDYNGIWWERSGPVPQGQIHSSKQLCQWGITHCPFADWRDLNRHARGTRNISTLPNGIVDLAMVARRMDYPLSFVGLLDDAQQKLKRINPTMDLRDPETMYAFPMGTTFQYYASSDEQHWGQIRKTRTGSGAHFMYKDLVKQIEERKSKELKYVRAGV